jgi:formate hydrogenlyase subunit 3/multisubunit Na+/H+ antiporter MnhD subunit
MVDPIYIVASGLGIAFLLGLIKRAGRKTSGMVMLFTLAFMTFISVQWLWALVFNQHEPHYTYTAGFKPPFSINLLMSRHESILTTMINALGLLGGIYLRDKFRKEGVNSMIVYLVLFMGLNVIVMTRDIFNLFVFLEVVSIGTAGLIILERKTASLSAGFKYMIATGIIAGFLLLGIIFAYQITGSLNIDDMMEANLWYVKGGVVAVFMILIAVIFELKPFPANGWALDVYEGANPGIGTIISAGIATVSLFVLYKLLNLGGESWHLPVAIAGLITFLGSNLLGLNQNSSTRLLGYSSTGQIGLMVVVIGLSTMLGEDFEFIIFTILIGHFLAKAGLFWMAGMLRNRNLTSWSALRKKPLMLFLMGTFIFALIGLPPFPSFFGKWKLIMHLAGDGMMGWVACILLATLLESVYLLRWFGYAAKKEIDTEEQPGWSLHRYIPVVVVAGALYGFSYLATQWMEAAPVAGYLPFVLVVALFVLDFLPAPYKNTIAIGGLGYYAYWLIGGVLLPEGDIVRIVFAGIFLIGAVILLIPGYNKTGTRRGFYPLVTLMFAGLAMLIEASTTLQFFFGWEIMTLASYLLILRGRKAMHASLKYIIFSLGGAYLMMAGFALAYDFNGSFTLHILNGPAQLATWIFALVALGLIIKMAILGFQVWLPGSYTEAEDDVTPMISSVLIKSGILGFLIFLIPGITASSGGISIPYILGWLGAITAVTGNMLAVYQEDAKKLVAYSSIGVMGYILFAVSMTTSLGTLTAATYGVLHFLYKALLFLAVGGVILRTGTRKFYEMGGLIKRMPLSFITVLIGIITLAGMPPLAGFAGKWLFYNAIIAKGWYIQGTMIIFAGIIAFLYCFKLIHNIFLGPLKDNHRRIRETTVWWLAPQIILVMAIMVLSVYPRILLEPLGSYLAGCFPGETIRWEGTRAYTSLGYWDATQIMYVVGGMFVVLFGVLFLMTRKAKRIGQFDMVYQAERPFRPETTHFAHNMFAHYRRSFGFVAIPRITGFWNSISGITHDAGEHIRKIYSGNGQAYALHIVLYFIIFFALLTGGL